MEVQHKTCKRTHNQTINCASLCCCRFHTSTTTSPRSILTWCTSKRSTSWTSTMTAASATTSTSVSSAASTTKTSCKTSSSTFVGLSKNGSGLSHCLAYTFRWGSTMFPPMFDTRTVARIYNQRQKTATIQTNKNIIHMRVIKDERTD